MTIQIIGTESGQFCLPSWADARRMMLGRKQINLLTFLDQLFILLSVHACVCACVCTRRPEEGVKGPLLLCLFL